jgi:hypothetical protein
MDRSLAEQYDAEAPAYEQHESAYAVTLIRQPLANVSVPNDGTRNSMWNVERYF